MSPSSLAALLHQQVTTCGTQPFLQEWKSSKGVTLTLSFANFAAHVAAAVAHLSHHGVEPADRVALLSHPTATFFVHAYAVMAMGGTSALLNWRQPADTLAAMVASSGCTVLLCGSNFEAQVNNMRAAVDLKLLLWLDWPTQRAIPPGDVALPNLDNSILPDLNEVAARLPVDQVRADTLALIMFTSGSTSTPKPVPFTHTQLLWSLAHNQQQRLHCAEPLERPGAGTLSFLPNFHVIGFINNFLSNLYAGLRFAVLQDAGSILTPQLLLEACVDLRPTLIDSVPVMVEGLLQRLEKGHVSPEERKALTQVYAVMAGGCQLNEELLVPLAHKHEVRLIVHCACPAVQLTMPPDVAHVLGVRVRMLCAQMV